MTHPVVYRKSGDAYMGTETSFEKSRAAIEKMLERYKVEDLMTRKTMQTFEGSGLKEQVPFYTIGFRKAGYSYLIEFPVIIQDIYKGGGTSWHKVERRSGWTSAPGSSTTE